MNNEAMEAKENDKCKSCGGSGSEADYVGLDMKCVEVECSMRHGSGLASRLPARMEEPSMLVFTVTPLPINQPISCVWVGPGPEPICTCGMPVTKCTRLHDDHYPPKMASVETTAAAPALHRQLLEARKEIAELERHYQDYKNLITKCLGAGITFQGDDDPLTNDRAEKAEAQCIVNSNAEALALSKLKKAEATLALRDDAQEIFDTLEKYGFDVSPAGLGTNGKRCYWYVGYKQMQGWSGITLDIRSPENTTVGHADTLIEAVRKAAEIARLKGVK